MLGEHLVARERGDVGVQGRIGRDEAFRVVGGQRVQPVLLQLPQPVDVLGSGALCGQPRRVGLQYRANPEQLVYLVFGGDVHERALRGTEFDPAVGLQALQGFSHRLTADAEVLGQFGLDDVLAPLQGAVDDQFHDRVVDGLAEGSRDATPEARWRRPACERAYGGSGWQVTSRVPPTKLLPANDRVQTFVCNKLPLRQVCRCRCW